HGSEDDLQRGYGVARHAAADALQIFDSFLAVIGQLGFLDAQRRQKARDLRLERLRPLAVFGQVLDQVCDFGGCGGDHDAEQAEYHEQANQVGGGDRERARSPASDQIDQRSQGERDQAAEDQDQQGMSEMAQYPPQHDQLGG